MELADILRNGGITVGIVILSLIKIPKLEINIWGLIGRAINKEQKEQNDKLQKSIDTLSKRLDEFIQDEVRYRKEQEEDKLKYRDYREQKDADKARSEILMFNEELLRSVRHSKERFDNILERVDEYEDYCDTHPLYKNNKAESAIANIKHTYGMCQEQRDFL